MKFDPIRRLPLYSLAAAFVLAASLLSMAATEAAPGRMELAALGLLPLAATLVDAIRLRSGRRQPAGQGRAGAEIRPGEHELEHDLLEKAETIAERERLLNARALKLQQWLQFPDAIDFRSARGDSVRGDSARDDSARGDSGLADPAALADPMARHDRELLALIESKTKQLFDAIKRDAYRVERDGQRVFDNEKIRQDLVALISDVVAIYRPGDPAPLLKTNIEAISRAVGRGSLRLLVAVEALPGGLSNYNFQSIYTTVSRAVKTFGMYKVAKPYLDLASGMWLAGRVFSSSNPITLVAWWAASKATTYGASVLGQHLLDQQAVGLIRQLVEIIAIEVASVYSPMVRYRDVHWVYGVELVHLASRLSISDAARVEAMKQIARLNLRDEYGRVSLMRHLAAGTEIRPARYSPAESLSAEQRMTVVERLEGFLLEYVLADQRSRTNHSDIEQWQTEASERLEIQFRAGHTEESAATQSERAAWALAAFALEHLEEAPERLPERLRLCSVVSEASPQQRREWNAQLRVDPPYLYHPPMLDPERQLCDRFLEDLVQLAAGRRATRWDDADAPSPPDPAIETRPEVPAGPPTVARPWRITLPAWSGEDALRVTAYFLRRDAEKTLQRFHEHHAARLLAHSEQREVPRPVARVLEYVTHSAAGPRLGLAAHDTIRAVFCDGVLAPPSPTVPPNAPARDSAPAAGAGQRPTSEASGAKPPPRPTAAHLVRIDSRLIAFSVEAGRGAGTLEAVIWTSCDWEKAEIEKLTGYLRSDCRVRFPDGQQIVLTGSSLRGYETSFAGLIRTD